MVGSSILLGAVFIAVGYLVSALARERGTAGGIAIGIWLVFVLIYDMAFLGLLVVDQGQVVSGGLLDALLLLNPTDAYRLFNLAGSANVSSLSGMAGIAQNATLSPPVLLAALAAWTLVPRSRSQRSPFPGENYETAALLAALARPARQAATTENGGGRAAPNEMTAAAIGHYCGMNVLEHAGTEGADHPGEPEGAGLVLIGTDAMSFTMLPEEPKDIRAIYVSDMAKAPSWEEPGRRTGSTRRRLRS